MMSPCSLAPWKGIALKRDLENRIVIDFFDTSAYALNSREHMSSKETTRKLRRQAIVGLVCFLLGCAESPVADVTPQQPYRGLSLAIVEQKTAGEKFNAGVFDDMTKVLVANFGAVTIAKTVEEAKASNPDLIALLSVDSDVSTHIFANGRVDARGVNPIFS